MQREARAHHLCAPVALGRTSKYKPELTFTANREFTLYSFQNKVHFSRRVRSNHLQLYWYLSLNQKFAVRLVFIFVQVKIVVYFLLREIV